MCRVLISDRRAYVPSQDGAARFKLSRLCSAVNPAGLVGQRAADVLDVRRVSVETVQPAIGPVLLLPRQRVWEGAGPARARSPIRPTHAPAGPIGCLGVCSRGAIGEAVCICKWDGNTWTRGSVSSAAGRKVNPGLVLVTLQAFSLIISSGRWWLTGGVSVVLSEPGKGAVSSLSGATVMGHVSCLLKDTQVFIT